MQVDGVDGVGLEPMRFEKFRELLYRVLLEPAPEQIKSYFDVIEAGFLAEGEILFQSRAVAGAGFSTPFCPSQRMGNLTTELVWVLR